MTNYDRVSNWLNIAGKEKTDKNVSVQIGVQIEEFVEFLETLFFEDVSINEAIPILSSVANGLKKDGKYAVIVDRVGCLDSLCDQDVTLSGISYLADFNFNLAIDLVLNSNDSKFDDTGKAIILPGGKIGKSSNYKPPDLSSCI